MKGNDSGQRGSRRRGQQQAAEERERDGAGGRDGGRCRRCEGMCATQKHGQQGGVWNDGEGTTRTVEMDGGGCDRRVCVHALFLFSLAGCTHHTKRRRHTFCTGHECGVCARVGKKGGRRQVCCQVATLSNADTDNDNPIVPERWRTSRLVVALFCLCTRPTTLLPDSGQTRGGTRRRWRASERGGPAVGCGTERGLESSAGNRKRAHKVWDGRCGQVRCAGDVESRRSSVAFVERGSMCSCRRELFWAGWWWWSV